MPEPSPRVAKLKARLQRSPYEIDIERAASYTKAWQENGLQKPCMKAAAALRRALREMTIRIENDEQLVGVKTAKRLAGVIPVERGEFNTVLDLELDRLLSRRRNRFHILEREKKELEETILPYWKGNTVRDRKVELWKANDIYSPTRLGPGSLYRIAKGMGLKNTGKIGYQTLGGSIRSLPGVPAMQRELAGLRPNLALTVFDVQGHFVPGYRRVLELGFDGIGRIAERRLSNLDPLEYDYEHKKDFLESVKVVADAVCDYSLGYAELAEKMAEGREGPRRGELLEIAERCRRVPKSPPASFKEALQSLWMTQVALSISYGAAGILSNGRLDWYLYPYYEKDLEAERITRDEAMELLEEFLVKISNYVIMLIETGKDTASEMGVGSNTFTVGGVDSEGKDATNELSYMLIEAHDRVRAMANNISVRIHGGSPSEFLKRACESYRSTSGLALFNDEVIVPELVEDGFSLEDARDYSIVGCVEPTSTGNCFACTAGNDISLAGMLEMALDQGKMLFSGTRDGAVTPDPASFASFEDVKDAFEEQVSYGVDKLVKAVELLDQAYREQCPAPLLSSTLEGCLESATDMTRGGAKYEFGSITGRGLGTVTDSLAAIKWAVFDQGFVSMDELMRHIKTNFRGAEALRQKLWRLAPKYGNDDPEADSIARWVTELFAREVRKHECGRGGFYRPGMFSYGVHVIDGLYLGATPDGRLAGEPVSNGISPVNGTEQNGPTAVLRSAAEAGAPPLSDGTALNMRLSPSLFSKDESVEKLTALVRGYFDIGGRHVQFNVVDTETLKDAQVHPERYPDLVVRVSGYCAYFTDLGKSIQDDIIARTNFEGF